MNPIRLAPVFAIALAGMAAVGPAPAADPDAGPSFNCAGVKSWVRRTICGDADLSRKDLQMARAFSSFVEQMTEGGGPGTDTSDIVEEQRAWLARRDQCRTRSCLHRVYDERIAALDVDY